MPLNKSRGYKKEEEEFAKDIMDYWANFAKSGYARLLYHILFVPLVKKDPVILYLKFFYIVNLM